MPKLRVHNFALSLDGYAAGPDQSLDDPLGVGGGGLHEWAFATRTMRRMHGMDGGEENLDDWFVAQGDVGIGATIMGRNMFGPIRGPWGDESWTGWWGDDPPYHHPVFVLTHHPRASITMQGGTTFYFVTDGIGAALERAIAAADGNDVRLGGGVATIQQYLRAGLVDEMHLAIVPILLRSGERLFDHLDGGPVGYECVELVSSPSVVHARLAQVGESSEPSSAPARDRVQTVGVPDEPDPKRVQKRADALPTEEQEAGSDDPSAQAKAILAESDARSEDRVSPPGKPVERRRSEDTVEPAD